MAPADAMRLDEARALLGVSATDELEAIKSAYRKLAFSLHPDLNPDDPRAKRKFQRLNEAYLLLRHFHANREREPGPAAAGQARPGPQPGPKTATAGARREQGPGPGQAHRQRQARAAYTQASRQNADAGFFFRREEVLQDLLKDPFARQVFQDIYRQVRASGRGQKPLGKKELTFKWGDKAVSLDLTKGLWGNIKAWFMRQLDDEPAFLAQLPLLSGEAP